MRSDRSVFRLASSALLAVLLLVPVSSAAAARGGARSPSTFPAGFRAQSISWISPRQGWLLGSGTCGSSECATVLGTTDGGGTWNTLSTFDAPVTIDDRTGVSEVRFADPLHGWAFMPAFWSTVDGGASWQRAPFPGGGHQILGLAGDREGVYALVSPCPYSQLCDLPTTLWKTVPGQGSWTEESISLPSIAGFGTAVLAVHGVVAYLGVPAGLDSAAVSGDILAVTTDGQRWSSRRDPCDPANGETLTDVVAISDTDVALLCQGNFLGGSRKYVYRSDDTAKTVHWIGYPPDLGNTNQLAASPNGTLLMSASSSIGDWIYRNTPGSSVWTTPVDFTNDGQLMWNDIVMTTNHLGWVVFNPADFFGGSGQVFQTIDGGQTWTPVG